MQQIQKLPESLVNQIAAGEVVESPFSVIKELVENSIDAASSKIMISIKNGGRDFIQVLDNGKGMNADDCRLAVERHATSKIKKIEDLYSISSMGFRGEALAAIASVAELEITTSQSDEEAGFNLCLDFGKKTSETHLGFSRGTRVVVKNIFQNIPARLKFLKSVKGEIDKIYNEIICFALAHPEIEFKLLDEKKTLLELPKKTEFIQRLTDCLGKRIVENFIFLKHQESYLNFEVYISLPDFCRINKKMQYEYINARHIKSTHINRAIYKGYGSLLPRQMHPVYLMKLDLEPAEIDVNVHPAKIEVRLRNHQLVQTIITEQIQLQLRSQAREHYNIPATMENHAENTASQKTTPDASFNSLFSTREISKRKEPNSSFIKEDATNTFYSADSSIKKDETFISRIQDNRASKSLENFAVDSSILKKNNILEENLSAVGMSPLEKKSINLPVCSILGVFTKYLFAVVDQRLAIVDVHAAHERIRFEELKKIYQGNQEKKKRLESYILLHPFLVSFSSKEAQTIQSQSDFWYSIGFEVEDFGNGDVSVKEIPSILRSDKNQEMVIRNFILEVLDEWQTFGKMGDQQQFILSSLQTMACHSSIRGQAGVNQMSHQEMKNLILQLYTSGVDLYCPHGRPVIVFREEKELDRIFKR